MAGPGFSVPFDSPLMRLPLVNKNRKKVATSSEAVIKDKIIAAPPKDKITKDKVNTDITIKDKIYTAAPPKEKITIEKIVSGEKVTIEKVVPAEKVGVPPPAVSVSMGLT